MPDIVRYSSHGLNKEPFNDRTTFDHSNTELVHYSDVQWGSEIRPSLDFEWSKTGWVANGLDFEWDLKSGSPTI